MSGPEEQDGDDEYEVVTSLVTPYPDDAEIQDQLESMALIDATEAAQRAGLYPITNIRTAVGWQVLCSRTPPAGQA